MNINGVFFQKVFKCFKAYYFHSTWLYDLSIKYNMNQILKVNGEKIMDEIKISPEDWILLFLFASDKFEGKRQIKGMLMFTKQFFIFVKEIKKDLDDYFQFIAYDFGPYSFVLRKKLEHLARIGLIEIINEGDREDFYLTDIGLEKIKNKFEILDPTIKERMKDLRQDATQLGYSGVLRYVYSRYPEYTSASKIKRDVLDEY